MLEASAHPLAKLITLERHLLLSTRNFRHFFSTLFYSSSMVPWISCSIFGAGILVLRQSCATELNRGGRSTTTTSWVGAALGIVWFCRGSCGCQWKMLGQGSAQVVALCSPLEEYIHSDWDISSSGELLHASMDHLISVIGRRRDWNLFNCDWKFWWDSAQGTVIITSPEHW